MEGNKPKGFGEFDKLMKGLVNVKPPTVEEVAASLAAIVFLMEPAHVKRLHEAIDNVAGAGASEQEFGEARNRLAIALSQRMERK